jgi:hypothetical protein
LGFLQPRPSEKENHDRLELDYLLQDLECIDKRISELQEVIAERCSAREDAKLLTSMCGRMLGCGSGLSESNAGAEVVSPVLP